MEKITTPLSGAFLVRTTLHTDSRGSFVKTFHSEVFSGFGVSPTFVEEFYSISSRNVIRGMHYQNPPSDHAKYVSCLSGAVRDVILDLRKNSSTYGAHYAIELSAENRLGFYIPSGFAHGFLSLTEGSIMLYKTTSVHDPACDSGIRWNSFGYNWGIDNPIMSERDKNHSGLFEITNMF